MKFAFFIRIRICYLLIEKSVSSSMANIGSTTFAIKTCSKTIFRTMQISTMTFGKVTLAITTLIIMTISLTTLGMSTLSIAALSIMTLSV